MKKFVLIIMVRNEERILKRCLESVESFVDAFCIHDTGSTDRTCEIASEFLKTHPGCLTTSEWNDFGHNRSLSFTHAQEYMKNLVGEEELNNYYGLLLDADMVFQPGTLKEQDLTYDGYTIVQFNGNLEYPNTRLLRMDFPWRCKSVTHEYWAGPTVSIPKEICHIDDRNDGGCKGDKFERDARLLERGLEEEPDNVRYMFYLAQTYHGLGKLDKCIELYKKRIAAGGWGEEVWYSMYMIAQTYLTLGNPIKFEQWMLKAYEYNPRRAESLYKLTEYFRTYSQHYKAYEYMLKGINAAYPTDSLFIEKDVYNGLFYYEKSILDYYVKSDRSEGLLSSMQCLLKTDQHRDNVLSNLVFYATPLKNITISSFEYTKQVFGDNFKVSAVSVNGNVMNLRYINYWMENGEYKTPEGQCVQTRNAMFLDDYLPVDEGDLSEQKRDVYIRGFEDIRLYTDSHGTLSFLANTQEYEGGTVRMVKGRYNQSLTDCVLIKNKASCEKNWLPINGTDNIIYNWFPLKIGKLEEDELVFHTVHSTPPLFSLFRGSASPFVYENELWTLVHFVKYDTPRKYYHCFVSLDIETFKPKAVSLPFVFKSASVEYCISARLIGRTVRCNATFMDANPSVIEFPVDSLKWISL